MWAGYFCLPPIPVPIIIIHIIALIMITHGMANRRMLALRVTAATAQTRRGRRCVTKGPQQQVATVRLIPL